MRKIIEFTSHFDGSKRFAVVRAPDDLGDKPLPLVIVPHAAGFSAEATAAYWRGIPERRGVIAVFPFGHGRKLDLYCLGWRGQIADLASLPQVLAGKGYSVDTRRIYSVGISMGGLESLLLAGKHPGLLAGVAAYNAVVDLNTWFYDCDDTIRSSMIEEMGGTPDQIPGDYLARSPINFAEVIAASPVILYYDPDDDMVQFQEDKQSGLLYRRMTATAPNARIEERHHSFGHFYIRPNRALDWLLDGEPQESGVSLGN
ncbi:MAG TPA: prolyl oligopeptidase family serine peptidase [Armatimonadota bacterium]|jgi:dipeptidyl aminopeptidase/acylaminoacyl peptidase